MTLNFCEDCRWFREKDGRCGNPRLSTFEVQENLVRRPRIIRPLAKLLRQDQDKCGSEGFHFSPSMTKVLANKASRVLDRVYR